MWKATQPDFDVEDVVRACASDIRDPALKQAVLDSISDYLKNSALFQRRAANGTAWGTLPADYPLSLLDESRQVWLYESKLVAQTSAARAFYELLKASSQFKQCPYCNGQPAATLDHVLPKKPYHSLSIDPWNLVPCCGPCNQHMNNKVASSAATEYFHAYFAVPEERWLYAAIIPGDVCAAVFTCDPPSDWDTTTIQRVSHQFETLDLANKYADLAGGVFVEKHFEAQRNFDAAKEDERADEVAKYLRHEANSAERLGVNHWRAALYRAMADSEWYCGGGFRADGL